MIGVELESKGGFGTLAPKVAAECHKRDLILLSCGPYDTLRLIPPLNVTEHEINKGVSTLCDAILAATAAAAAAAK